MIRLSFSQNKIENAAHEESTQKIDLVTWTLNSAKTLPFTLTSIEKAIPRKHVNQKFMVDGHSTDETTNIGKMFGWNVVDAKRVGIPYQANQALEMVETEFFASFEHDVILNPNWLPAMLKHLRSDPQVAVAQGVRVATNFVLKSIEEVSLERNIRYSSLDNTLYRTDVIRCINGFDPRYPISCDRDLQSRVWKAGYKWIVDKTVVSDHLRGSVWQNAEHIYNLSKFAEYTDNPSLSEVLPRFLFSPFRGAEITIKKDCPQAFVVYPYLRFALLKTALKAVSELKQLKSQT